MAKCAAPSCKHSSESHQCSFFPFPKRVSEVRVWVELLRIKDIYNLRDMHVCSCHFLNCNQANGPTIFKHDNGTLLPKKTRKRKKTAATAEKKYGPTGWELLGIDLAKFSSPQASSTLPHLPLISDVRTVKTEQGTQSSSSSTISASEQQTLSPLLDENVDSSEEEMDGVLFGRSDNEKDPLEISEYGVEQNGLHRLRLRKSQKRDFELIGQRIQVLQAGIERLKGKVQRLKVSAFENDE